MSSFRKSWSSLALVGALAACDPGKPEPPPEPRPYIDALARLGKKPSAPVEGCTACHVGVYDPSLVAYPAGEEIKFVNPDLQARAVIMNPDAAGRRRLVRMLMAHPKLDLVGPASFHPKLSCETCHATADRSNDPALTPVRRERWQRINMKPHPVVKELALKRLDRIEAVCLRCHAGEEPLYGADALNRGKILYERASCYACHTTPGMKTMEADLAAGEHRMRKPGPPLDRIASKVDKKWAKNWLLHPPSFKPTARMPPFFPRGDAGFPPQIIAGVSKEEAPEFERTITACVIEYLFSIARPAELDELPPEILETEDWKVKDQQNRGRALALDKGCLACHRFEENYPAQYMDTNSFLEEEFATNLFGSGDKFDSPVGRRWLFNWLKRPSHYHPDTSMPDFRLADAQIGDLIQFLLSLKIDNPTRKQRGFKAWEPREFDATEPALDRLLAHQKGPTGAALREKILWEGKNVVEIFACYSCHALGGEWDRRPVVHGAVSDDLVPTRGIMERMPLMDMSLEENNLFGTYLWGQLEALHAPPDRRAMTARDRVLAEGERILAKFNCQGCHVLEEVRIFVRDGGRPVPVEGAIKSQVDRKLGVEWLRRADTLDFDAVQKKYPGLLPEEAVDRALPPRGGTYVQRRLALAASGESEGILSRLPPPLRTAGRKLDPDWLQAFLRRPEPIRPWQGPVMPTFAFAPGEIESLVEFFKTRDGAGPEDRQGRLTQDQIDARYPALLKADQLLRTNCMACHSVDGEGKTLSVDLARVHGRIQRPWLKVFLQDPGSIYSATAMPQFPKDASLDDMVDLLLNYDRMRSAKVRLGDVPDVLDALKAPEADELARLVLRRAAREPALEEAVGSAIDIARRRKLDVRAELEVLLASASAGIRIAAIEGLAAAGALDKLVERLGDPDRAVRKAALNALGSRKFAGAIAGLLKDSDALLRRAALDVLERVDASDQAAAIAACLSDAEASLRVRAAEVLGEMGAVDQAGALQGALKDGSAQVRWAALLALARLGKGPGAEKSLDDPEASVRAASAACLIRSGDARGVETLKKSARAQPMDALTREAVRLGIDALVAGPAIEPGERAIEEWLELLGAQADPALAIRGRVRAKDGFGLLVEISQKTGGVFVTVDGRLKLVPLERGIESLLR